MKLTFAFLPVTRILLPVFLASCASAPPAVLPVLPAEDRPVTYSELTAWLGTADQASDLLTVSPAGKSVQGRNLFTATFSEDGFGSDPEKVKVLFFAQQHGNEQSGKQGALLLIRDLLSPENRYLFSRVDLMVIPQVNPDGSEQNQRRNGNNMDLNRNHLILTEPESRIVEGLVDRWKFEATLDVHEYAPYGGEWETLGIRRNFDEQLGYLSNPNVAESIRNFQAEEAVPFIEKEVTRKGFSFFIYSPGGPPEKDYIRYSTYDINDGRQCPGIQNSFSFILEGLNGEDNFKDRIARRAEGQKTAMMSLLKFIYSHHTKIKSLVAEERRKLVSGEVSPTVAIQMDHVPNGKSLSMPLLSLKSGRDTVITVRNFRPVVQSSCTVTRPEGYLIPKSKPELIEWADRHHLEKAPFPGTQTYQTEGYWITGTDSLDFEGDPTVNPSVETRTLTGKINPDDYVFLPTRQLKNNLIVLALEPKSTLGLHTYRQFAHLLEKGTLYPVLRVIRPASGSPAQN